MRLKNLDLNQIVPEFMQGDACVKALVSTIEPVVKEMAANMRRVSIWANIENLSEPELDQIAKEMDIPWYNPIYDRQKKIKIIKEGEKLVKKMGTPYALQYVIDDIFGSCTISEAGIDYEGEPHRFTITVNSGVNLNATTYGRFMYLLNKIKRASSWIESVGSVYFASGTAYRRAFISDQKTDAIKCDNMNRIEWPTVVIRHTAGYTEAMITQLELEQEAEKDGNQ